MRHPWLTHNIYLSKQRLLALRLLAACSQHAIFVKEAFSLPGPPNGVAAVHLSALQNLVRVGKDGDSMHEETALVIIMIFYRWMKACGDNIHIVTCAIECGTAALADPQVRKARDGCLGLGITELRKIALLLIHMYAMLFIGLCSQSLAGYLALVEQ